jgi:hypothetical protein
MDSVCRISLSDVKYQVINMPSDIEWFNHPHIYLGKSAKRVAYFCERHQLQVWLLDESCDQIEWVLKHHIDMPLILTLECTELR